MRRIEKHSDNRLFNIIAIDLWKIIMYNIWHVILSEIVSKD